MSGHKTVEGEAEAEAEAGDGAGLLWGWEDKMCVGETKPGRLENNSL